MNTKQLYSEDAYLKDCHAKILKIHNNGNQKKSGKSIILDKTVLQPQNRDGGDKGIIKNINGEMIVKKVVKNNGNGIILHNGKIKGSLIEGDEVTVNLDWNVRYIQMRKHDMFHLFYSCAREIVGQDFLALSKISIGTSYTDWLDKVDLDVETINKSLEMANEVIKEDREISIKILPRKEALNICGDFFSNIIPKNTETLRLVTIEGFKPDPCIGLHVRKTGEIGSFNIQKIEKQSSNLRIIKIN